MEVNSVRSAATLAMIHDMPLKEAAKFFNLLNIDDICTYREKVAAEASKYEKLLGQLKDEAKAEDITDTRQAVLEIELKRTEKQILEAYQVLNKADKEIAKKEKQQLKEELAEEREAEKREKNRQKVLHDVEKAYSGHKSRGPRAGYGRK